MLSFDINEVGPVAVKPSGENNTSSFKSVLINGNGPRPQVAWKPKAQAGSHKTVTTKSDLQHLRPKYSPIKLGDSQPRSSVFTNTVPSLSPLAYNAVQPSVSGLVSGSGSSASHPFSTCDTDCDSCWASSAAL